MDPIVSHILVGLLGFFLGVVATIVVVSIVAAIVVRRFLAMQERQASKAFDAQTIMASAMMNANSGVEG